MKLLYTIAIIASLFACEAAHAQNLKFPAAPANSGGMWHGGGYGGFGGGWGGGYGGWGFGGFGRMGFMMNPYNPYSPYSPYNPISPYSPYNAMSPISPYYNPYSAPYYASVYLYNPIYNPGLMSRNPAVQMMAWNQANYAATNVYAYSNYYASQLQYQQAAMTNYSAAIYNQQAQNNYLTSQAYSQMAQYQLLAAQQPRKNRGNSYPQQESQQPAPLPVSGKQSSGFSGGQTSNYDPYAGVSQYTSAQGNKSFEANMKAAPPPPTYGEEQYRIATERLRRIQTVSSPGEIIGGSAQNVLLDDIRKFIGTQPAMPTLTIPDETLKEINILKNGQGNLAALRNDGKIAWPTALGGYILTQAEKTKVQNTVNDIITSAVNDKIENGKLIDLGQQITDMRNKLMKAINDIPTNDYLNSKRFLNDLSDAALALQNNEWANHMEYQKFIDKGFGKGRSIQDLVKYMVEKGLHFAPATAQDEGSYKALYSALVAYDLAANAQMTAVAKE